MSHILNPEIEAQTLALLTLRVMREDQALTSIAFKYALPVAYECLRATKAFLKQKEEEAAEEAKVYWSTEEDQKRRAEALAQFEDFKKKNQS